MSAALDNIAENLGKSAVKSAGKTAIGLIPIAGDIAVFFIDLGVDYNKEKAEAKQNLNEMQSSIGSIRDANYASKLYLDTVIISDGTINQQMIVYPSHYTQNIIDNINDHFNAQDAAQYGLSYPITMDDVLSNSNAVNELLNDMTPSESAYVLNPSN